MALMKAWNGPATAELMHAVQGMARVDLRLYRRSAWQAALAERLAHSGLADEAPATYLERLRDPARSEARALIGTIERQAWSQVANPLADTESLHTLATALPLLGARPGREPALQVWLPACPDLTHARLLAQWLAAAVGPAAGGPAAQAPLVPGWRLHVSRAHPSSRDGGVDDCAPLRGWPVHCHVHHALHDAPLPGGDLLIAHGLLAPLRPSVQRPLLRRLLRSLSSHGLIWLGEEARTLAAELGLASLGDGLVFRAATAATRRPGRHLRAAPAPSGSPPTGPAAAQRALLDQVAALAARGEGAALYAIGLDHADDLRAAAGHAAVDTRLAQAARRLRPAAGADGVPGHVWRPDGDGLRLLQPGLPNAATARVAALQLQQALALAQAPAAPHLSWSVGVALLAGVPVDPRAAAQRLLHQAEAALAQARRQGRGGVEVCGEPLARRLDARALVVAELPGAVARGDLLLHYQPQFAVADGRLVGVEALVRWRHPLRGLVMPDAFIGHAEEAGLIDELGDWVLREACQQARSWQLMGLPAVPMAVNVSGRQLQQPDFPARVRAALAAAGLAPGELELELTESSLLQQPEAAAHLLAECRRLGVRVSLDDFGTGYSSLALLHRFGVDRLKIDRSFFADVPGDRAGEAIIRLVIALARELGIGTVAEGVEAPAQLDWLRQIGCEAYQGHLSAQAEEPAQTTRHLRAGAAGAHPHRVT